MPAAGFDIRSSRSGSELGGALHRVEPLLVDPDSRISAVRSSGRWKNAVVKYLVVPGTPRCSPSARSRRMIATNTGSSMKSASDPVKK